MNICCTICLKYMRKVPASYLFPVLVLSFVLSISSLAAQTLAPAALELAEKTRTVNRTGMLVLGSWAAGNMLLSGTMMSRRNGSDHYFHQMNVYWNLVNLGIACLGYYNAVQADAGNATSWSAMQDHFQTRQILLLNVGLNTAYMMTGVYLLERSKRGGDQADRLLGYGRSIIMQGAFLLVFDTVLYLFHQQHASLAEQLAGTAWHNGDGLVLGWSFKF